MTGSAREVEQVCGMFGVDFFADEGLMSHSVRTAIIDRQGVMVANIEGNRYTAAQLGDLVEATLRK
jgi:protein SCO1/2